MISESLPRRATAADGCILRDRVLSGFGVRLNARKRSFLIATRVSGQQQEPAMAQVLRFLPGHRLRRAFTTTVRLP
jgi:hypothetical protein